MVLTFGRTETAQRYDGTRNIKISEQNWAVKKRYVAYVETRVRVF